MLKRYFQNNVKRNFSIGTIWINGGSNMDGEGKKGINNILCSLITRGCEGFDNSSLADYIESYGAELNHEVTEDGMSISIKSLNDYFNKLFPLLELMVNKPTLSEKQFNIVKKSIINTLKKDRENPFNICFEKWRKIVYSNHSYSYNPIGYEEDVANITYEDVLLEYEQFKRRKKFLTSNNNDIYRKYFETPSKKVHREKAKYPEIILNHGVRFTSSYNQSNQIIIMLGNKTCSRKSNEFLVLKILQSHLSFGMSSVLFKLFREKNGITYDVGVLNSAKKDNCPFLIYLSVSNKNALLAFELLRKLWKELLSSLISDEDLFLAKEKLKSSYLLDSQCLDEVLLKDIQLISFGISPLPEKDYFTKIDSISKEDINELTNKYFSKPFISITGDKKICDEIKKIWIFNF